MSINFELLDLRAFLTVVDQGGFHKAAETLNLSQSALSRRVQALEKAIDAPLLERTTRHVALTAVGRSFAPMARRLIEELEAQLQTLTDGRQSGQVTIACVPTAAFYFLPRAIERFNLRFPRVRFRILDLSAHEAVDAVARGAAEFGINLTGGSNPELTFTPLMDDPFVLACHRAHPLATQAQVGWKDLERERLIGVSRSSGNRGILDNALARSGVRLTFFYEVNHLTTSLGLVEQGLGLSVLPRLAAPPADHPLIMTRPLADPLIVRTIGLVERRAGRLAPVAQMFRDMLMESWGAPASGQAGAELTRSG